MKNHIWLLISGSGHDGDEISIESIHKTRAGARQAKKDYEVPRKNIYGKPYSYNARIVKREFKD